MPKKQKITVFGATNIDIMGFAKNQLIMKDANIGTMEIAAGGVGRNIAHNLQLLDFQVDLISIFGTDVFSEFLINDCRKNKLNVDNSLVVKNGKASSFIAVMNKQNDLAVGVSAMDIYNEENTGKLLDTLPQKIDSEYLVLETNFDRLFIEKIVDKYPDKKIVADTVSGAKALRILSVLPHLYILKTNLLEAEMMSHIKVKNQDDLQELVRYFIKKGVKKVFITLGKDGVVYGDKDQVKTKKAIPSTIINTIGAGDSFVAGLVLADSLNLGLDNMAMTGMAAASITVQDKNAVNLQMSREKIGL